MLLPLVVLVLALVLVPSANARPNVVVFLTDDQTVSSVRYMPNVLRLLEERGTSFTRTFATFPLCCPSRVTLVTGQYAHNHGVIHNAGPFGGYGNLDHAETLPVWLQLAGYRTLQVGRWLNNYGVDNLNLAEIPPGWDEWFAPVGSSAQAYSGQTINDNGVLKIYGDYQTDLYAGKAIELIRRSPATAPFFLNMTFSAPHTGRPRDPDDPTLLNTPSPAPRHRNAFANVPLPAPPSFDEADVGDKPQDVHERPPLSPEMVAAITENWQQELESLLGVDEAVGAVMEELRRDGRLDNTLFVFTSDNGYMHGEHRIPSEKVWPYEESTRVPLIIRGPRVPEGLALGQLTGNIDVVPTILDAANAEPGQTQDGRSLFALMRDPTREWGREIVLESGFGANGVGGYRALRNYGYLYVEWRHSGEYELYDLKRDRWMLENVADEPAYVRIQAELARRLRGIRSCRGTGCSRKPKLRLRVRRSGSCTVRVSGREAEKVGRVDFFRGRRRIGRDRRPPFEIRLRARRLRARVVGRYGRLVTLDLRGARAAACR